MYELFKKTPRRRFLVDYKIHAESAHAKSPGFQAKHTHLGFRCQARMGLSLEVFRPPGLDAREKEVPALGQHADKIERGDLRQMRGRIIHDQFAGFFENALLDGKQAMKLGIDQSHLFLGPLNYF